MPRANEFVENGGSEPIGSVGWCAALFLVMTATIGLSFLPVRILLASSSPGPGFMYAMMGLEQGFRFAAPFVLVVVFALHRAAFRWRLLFLLCFFLPQVAMIAVRLTWQFPGQGNFAGRVVFGFLGLAMAVLGYCLASFLAFQARWTVRSPGDDRPAATIGVAKLLEVTLVVSIGCAFFLRSQWFGLYVSPPLFVYTSGFDALPALGTAFTTCCLFAFFLKKADGKRHLELGLRVLVVFIAMAVVPPIALYYLEDSISGPNGLAWSTSALTVSYVMAASLAQIPMLGCLRRAGLTLVTKSTRSPQG